MSLYQLFRNAIPRLTRVKWGNQIADSDGQKHDTGVNELAEEIAGMFANRAPITLDEPLRVIKNYTGRTFEVVTEPDVEAANDPLSSEGPNEVRGSLDEVAELAEAAQEAAEEAAERAANPPKQLFVGEVVGVTREKIQTGGLPVDGNYRYTVEIGLHGEVTQVQAYRLKFDTEPVTANGTLVMVYPVAGDPVVEQFLTSVVRQFFASASVSLPDYFFVESIPN